MKKSTKIILWILAIIVLVFSLLFVVGYPDWKESQIEKADMICKHEICSLNNSNNEFNDYVYAEKFNSCLCMNYPYGKKVTELVWWKV